MYADDSNHSAPIKSTATSMDFIQGLGRNSRRMQEILRHDGASFPDPPGQNWAREHGTRHFGRP